MDGCIIRDPQGFRDKVTRIRAAGLEALHIVTDFDGTLTHAYSKGKRAPTSLSVLRDNNLLSSDYADSAKALADIFWPIEHDPSLAPELKREKMIQWWQLHLELMIKSGMHKAVVEEAIALDTLLFREGVDDLLAFSNKHRVPLLIFSAGLGDIIMGNLQRHGKLNGSTHVISNYFAYDEADKVLGYTAETIHMHNKNEQSIQHAAYAPQIASRRNVLLLGDRPGDVTMAEGFPHDVCLRVGFLNGHREQLESFNDFDMLLEEDASMEAVIELLRSLH